jgi:NADPH:quinone reductase-like Zn-dependent oxidoreductase
MKAIVRDSYGGPEALTLREAERPSIEAQEVLVRVHASSVSIGDWFALTGTPTLYRLVAGIRNPKAKILGRDMAGVVEAVGPGSTEFQPGDEVYGELDFGAHAEYVAAPADKITHKPSNLGFEEAAAVPIAGGAALQGLRDAGHIKAGHRVLINGASGAVGTFAVQIAKALGAQVTGVCSTAHIDMVRSIGADRVIDYTTTDFTTADERYDLIFDLAASHSIAEYRRVLTPTGTYVASASKLRLLLRAALSAPFSGGQVAVFSARESKADLEVLRELIEAGQVIPVIERRYPLSEAPEAFRQQGIGHARGRKVISIAA